jgi:hypothetical protein
LKKCSFNPCKNLTELKYCSRGCEWSDKNFFTQAHGEVLSQSKKDEQPIELEQGQEKSQKKQEEESRSKTTINTEMQEIKKDPNIDEQTKRGPMSISETTMQEIKQPLRKEFYAKEKSETRSMDSQILLRSLNKDRLDSIDYLNDSTKQLLIVARATMAKKLDDNGDVIKNPSIVDCKDLVYILSEVRNQLKTKLEYLKLGKEIAKDL